MVWGRGAFAGSSQLPSCPPPTAAAAAAITHIAWEPRMVRVRKPGVWNVRLTVKATSALHDSRTGGRPSGRAGGVLLASARRRWLPLMPLPHHASAACAAPPASQPPHPSELFVIRNDEGRPGGRANRMGHSYCPGTKLRPAPPSGTDTLSLRSREGPWGLSGRGDGRRAGGQQGRDAGGR